MQEISMEMTPPDSSGAGIDACTGGWFSIIIKDGTVQIRFDESFENLISQIGDVNPILVDVPIGLATDSRRACDVRARYVLGCRGNSVFFAPSKAAIEEEDYDSANEAHRGAIGHGLSQQAYHIGNSIREVNNIVDDQYDGNIRESHPEICFLALNGQPVSWPKTSKKGILFRISLLETVYNDAQAIYDAAIDEYLRKEVSRDDILDSMVLAWAAKQSNLQTIPSSVESDTPRMYTPSLTDLVTKFELNI